MISHPNSAQNKLQTALRFLSRMLETLKQDYFHRWMSKNLREKFMNASQTERSSGMRRFSPVESRSPTLSLMGVVHRIQKYISDFVEAWANTAASVAKQTAELVDQAMEGGRLTQRQGQALKRAANTTLQTPTFLGKVLQRILHPSMKPEKPVFVGNRQTEQRCEVFQQAFDQHWEQLPALSKHMSEEEQCYQHVAHTLMGEMAATVVQEFLSTEVPASDFEPVMKFMSCKEFKMHTARSAKDIVDTVRNTGSVLGSQFVFERIPSPHVNQSFLVRTNNGQPVEVDQLIRALNQSFAYRTTPTAMNGYRG